jgi:hypothetical protein
MAPLSNPRGNPGKRKPRRYDSKIRNLNGITFPLPFGEPLNVAETAAKMPVMVRQPGM